MREPGPAALRPLQRPRTLAGRLARTLILWVGGVWLACVLAVVWYVDGEINHNFDDELIEVAHRLFDIALGQLDTAFPGAAPPLVLPAPQTFAETQVPHQLVTPEARVLARSAGTSAEQFDVPLAPGLANTPAWRVYTLRHPERPVLLQVADPLHERREAVNRTLVGLIVPLAAVLPLLALLLRHLARRELHVLDELAREIGLRDGRQLTPITLPTLPRELRRVEEHVNRLLERLAQALDVERALAANAAHELRTPLAAARLRLQTALEHGLNPGDVQAALQALERLGRRTEKLLQLSRAESSMPLAREPVDLMQLAHTVAQEFWQHEDAADRLDLEPAVGGSPARTLGDFDALAIALRNLVENALRHARGSPVEIRIGPGAQLSVRDFGPGASQEQLQSMQQRHVRHGADQPGYGLGLSIAATIARKHGGELRLFSPPGDGRPGLEARLLLEPAP